MKYKYIYKSTFFCHFGFEFISVDTEIAFSAKDIADFAIRSFTVFKKMWKI